MAHPNTCATCGKSRQDCHCFPRLEPVTGTAGFQELQRQLASLPPLQESLAQHVLTLLGEQPPLPDRKKRSTVTEAEGFETDRPDYVNAVPATAIPLDKLLPELLNRPEESGPTMARRAEPEWSDQWSDQHFEEWLRRPTMRLREVAAILGVSEKHVYRIPGLRKVRKGTFNTDSVKRVLAGRKK